MDSFELLHRKLLTLHIIQAEHIDNPKGYGDGEDARKYDPRLRGPVDVSRTASLVQVYISPLNYVPQPRELEVDPRTGMKNYIANGRCW
jgi:hypothetical protein